MEENGSQEAKENSPEMRPNRDNSVIQTKTLKISNKRFYLDLKETQRGKFIKIAEVAPGGRKSRIIMPIYTAIKFSEKLTSIIEVYDSLVPHDPSHLAEDGRLHSVSLHWDARKFHLELKENERGRFLRILMTSPPNGGPLLRSQIAVPAQGMTDLTNEMKALIAMVPEEEHEAPHALPDPKSFRVENRMFYFDMGSNRRGHFLRVSEVRPEYRTAITLPERCWPKFQEILQEIIAETPAAARQTQHTKSDKKQANGIVTPAGDENVTVNDVEKITDTLSSVKIQETKSSPGKKTPTKQSPSEVPSEPVTVSSDDKKN